MFYGLLILQHGRRQMLWLDVTELPTAEWVARQLTEARGWGRTRDTSSVIATASIARHSNGAFARWGLSDLPRGDRLGGMDTLNG